MSKEFIINLVVIVAFVIIVAILYYMNCKKYANKIILELVKDAEKRYGGGTGDVKYAYVVSKVYPALPTVIKVFITEKRLGELIDLAITKMESELAKGNPE